MARFCRIFGSSDLQPDPQALIQGLRREEVVQEIGADKDGWFWMELTAPELEMVRLERFLADEEGIRAELNAWAAQAELGKKSAIQTALMEHIIQSLQLITVEMPETSSQEEAMTRFVEDLCQLLAQLTDGIYQVDDRGFYSAKGSPIEL